MIEHDCDGVAAFAYYRPAARSVELTGDFNAWNTSTHSLQRDEHGWWRLRLSIPPGEYRFRYLVDRQLWEADFAAQGVELAGDGCWNSLLRIDAAGSGRQAA